METNLNRQADTLLPLKTAWLHVLIAIAEDARHGYAIRKRVEERTEGRVKLWPTSLYGTLDRLCSAGLLVEDEEPGAEESTRGRRDYQLTDLGVVVLRRETDRLEDLVRAARATPTLQDEAR